MQMAVLFYKSNDDLLTLIKCLSIGIQAAMNQKLMIFTEYIFAYWTRILSSYSNKIFDKLLTVPSYEISCFSWLFANFPKLVLAYFWRNSAPTGLDYLLEKMCDQQNKFIFNTPHPT